MNSVVVKAQEQSGGCGISIITSQSWIPCRDSSLFLPGPVLGLSAVCVDAGVS